MHPSMSCIFGWICGAKSVRSALEALLGFVNADNKLICQNTLVVYAIGMIVLST